MRFVIVDVIPALLAWRSRDPSGPPLVAPDAEEAIAHLHIHYRLIAITDAGMPSLQLRDALESEHLAHYFDSVVTSAGLGPVVNPRVIRRLIRHSGPGPVVVTGRQALADSLSRSRIGVVYTDRQDFAGVPAAVAMLIAGRVSP